MTKKEPTGNEKKGGTQKRVPRLSDTKTEKKDDEQDLVDKISDMKIGVTTRRASRLSEQSKQKNKNPERGVLTRQQMRMLQQQDADIQVKEKDVLSLKKVNFDKVPAPVGMVNACNMCYVNVILQALSKIPAVLNMTEELATKDVWKSDDVDATLAMNALLDIGQIVEQGNKTTNKTRNRANVLSDIQLHRVVQSRDPREGIGGAGQQDAFEFLQLLFDCLRKLEANRTSAKSKQAKKKSLLNEAISITMKMTRKCTVCSTSSASEESCNILTLTISDNGQSWSDCFENAFKDRILTGDDMILCKKCKKKTSSKSDSMVLSATDILVVHLNLPNAKTNDTYRLQRSIDIPTTLSLTLHPPTNKNSKKKDYALIAAVMHQGATKKLGHYTCYVQDEEKRWYFCNDDEISQLPENRLPFLQLKTTSMTNPYILFFSKAKSGGRST